MSAERDLDRDALDRWIIGNYGEDFCEQCEDDDGECVHREPPEDDPDRKRDEARDEEPDE